MISLLERDALRQPQLGFLGVGWIGRARMKSLADSGAATVHAIADTAVNRLQDAAAIAPGARCATSLDELLELELDGVVIATPSALHAEQCMRALEHGLAVFCQKPLARSANETRGVIDAARLADRFLGIDLSYRYTTAMRCAREAVRGGAIGRVVDVELTFHNAYGPDRGWARDPALAGGGCVIDLGTHLVDLGLWALDFPPVRTARGQTFCRGTRVTHSDGVCEDHATATVELESGAVLRVACSWEANTGQDAVIEAVFHGTEATVAVRNVDGSFHDLRADIMRGTHTQPLATPPDDWGGRALVEWSRRLATQPGFDPEVARVIDTATVLDTVLGR